jgi:hypothetical protein
MIALNAKGPSAKVGAQERARIAAETLEQLRDSDLNGRVPTYARVAFDEYIERKQEVLTARIAIRDREQLAGVPLKERQGKAYQAAKHLRDVAGVWVCGERHPRYE